MRIATFNLESLDPVSRGGVTIDERAEILRPQLERLRADVLCLQEVNGQRAPGAPERSLVALDALLAGTDYAGFHRVSSHGPDGSGVADVHNLVILSRAPILAHREIRHDLVPALEHRLITAVPAQADGEPVCFDRPILHAEIALADNRRAHIFNVHLRAPLAAAIPGQKEAPFVWKTVAGWAEGYFLSALKRSGQALELRLAIDAILDVDSHAAIVACGDFNAEDHETPLKIVVGAEEDTGNGRLASRSLAVLDRALSKDRRFSVLHHSRPLMLDHILASRSLMADFRSVEVHNEMLEDEVVGYTKVAHAMGSYHAPVIADLRRTERSRRGRAMPKRAGSRASLVKPLSTYVEAALR